MFRKIAITTVATLALSTGVALAAGGETHVEDHAFSFEGPFGTYDEHQLQRGLQVFTDVCASCHGLKFVPIRTLADEGGPNLPEDQVRAYAAAFSVLDEDSNRAKLWDAEKGEMRPLKDTDNFPINASAVPVAPDLSMMAKARAGFHGPVNTGINQLFKGIGGPEHIYSILTGYTGETKEEAGTTFYENHAFPGGWIAMPPPLADGQVTYQDGHDSSLHHMAEDVSAFLMWTAEPKMMDRKRAGFIGVALLILLTTLLYLVNKRLWSGIKGKDHA
jgi:ubiquinol-cytochrome c reductase cytochrome c1 subunit